MLPASIRSTLVPASRQITRKTTALSNVSTVALGAPRRILSTAAAKSRPLSPHLTIYKFPMNAQTSVAFRATGILLTGGAVATSIGLLLSDKPLAHYVKALKAHPFLTFLVKFAVVTPLTFHYLGGIRHLTWDNVIGHTPETVKRTGLVVLGATAGISLVAAFVNCAGKSE